MRTLPAEDVLGTLHHHALETHVGHSRTNLIVIEERTVAENFRVLSKHLFDFLGLALGLTDKILCVAQRRKSVAVRLCEELDTACSHQLTQKFKHLRSVLLNEFQRDAADAESYLEGFAVLCNHVEHRLHGRLVALFCQFCDDAFVLVVVVVIVVGTDVEETIALEMYRLMYLEV